VFAVFFTMNSPAGHRMDSHAHTPTASFREDRSKLFDRNGIKRGKPFSASSNTASEAANIQKSLHRTQALLKNELERVSHVASAIEDDGKMLQETMNDQQNLNVSSAKKALTSLQRAQQREQRVLMASIVFFYVVVFYIFWCRLLIRIPFLDRLPALLQF
jgi:hypothetical protein